ncbi:hypothetical protein BSKO_03778 [Bryopsis sp. KO-2023]|nr:hypothetical protein BSKO_03778 [Bryopsis sp. KO-2023]
MMAQTMHCRLAAGCFPCPKASPSFVRLHSRCTGSGAGRVTRSVGGTHHPKQASIWRRDKKRFRVLAKAATDGQASPKTAREAVETGLTALEEKNPSGALELFQKALKLNPNGEEARAAIYNSACCYAKMKKWQEAADSVKLAINDHSLKLIVAIEDDDLAALRDRREWVDMLTDVKGGISGDARVDLRSEAKAPFRLARIFLVGGFAVAAALGLLFTIPSLIAALQGGEGAPDLTGTLQNLGINSAGVLVLGFFLNRDLAQQGKDKAVVEREEALADLQVQLGSDKILPLYRLRGSVRPVIILGNKTHIQKSLRAARQYYAELKERGVSVIPVVSTDVDPAAKLRAVKQQLKGSSKGFKPEEEDDEEPENDKPDIRWKLEPYASEEWLEWIREQQEFSGVDVDNCYIQIQLDGSVRSSGVGMPPWKAFLNDIPPLDSIRTQLTDNIGTSL